MSTNILFFFFDGTPNGSKLKYQVYCAWHNLMRSSEAFSSKNMLYGGALKSILAPKMLPIRGSELLVFVK